MPRTVDASLPCKFCAGDPDAKGHRMECPKWQAFGGRPGPKGDRKPASAKGTGSYVKPLTEYMGMVGTAVYGAGMAKSSPQLVYDGQVILGGAAEWAESLQALADDNPRVAKVLDALTAASAWSMVTASTLGMVVPILACHRILPPEAAEMFGVERPPEVIVEVKVHENGQSGGEYGEDVSSPGFSVPEDRGAPAGGAGFDGGAVPPLA